MIQFIGRFHPVLVHLPIGFLLIALLFEAMSRRTRWQALQPALPFILLLGAAAAAFSCLSGWLLARSGEYENELVNRHQWLGIGVAIVSVAACWLKSKRHSTGYAVLSIVLLPGILLTGHWGISLTHGEGYLTQSTAAGEPETELETAPLFPEIPGVEVPEPSAEAIARLQQAGVAVLPVGKDQPFLSLNFVNVAEITPAIRLALAPLSKNVIWLKFSNTSLNDSTLALISGFENLTKLSLDHTNITDASLAHLQKLEHLVYLNLVGTKVTAQGVASLERLSNLRKLFLYQTGVVPGDTTALRLKLPHVQVDLGGYRVPVLPTDTTVLKKVEKG